jgi:hypothetical protein
MKKERWKGGDSRPFPGRGGTGQPARFRKVNKKILKLQVDINMCGGKDKGVQNCELCWKNVNN